MTIVYLGCSTKKRAISRIPYLAAVPPRNASRKKLIGFKCVHFEVADGIQYIIVCINYLCCWTEGSYCSTGQGITTGCTEPSCDHKGSLNYCVFCKTSTKTFAVEEREQRKKQSITVWPFSPKFGLFHFQLRNTTDCKTEVKKKNRSH